MTNNEKEVNESIINNILFFPTLKNGSFDHNISMNTNISNFNLDKKVEPSLPFFEYLCYKSIDKLILDKEKINQNTIIITEQFLLDQNCKIVLCSHLGRPKGEFKPEFSLAPVAKELSKQLGKLTFLK